MLLTLYTEGWFDAAHHLDKYDGACKNLHGHTYKVQVWVRGDSTELNHSNILWDFGNLKQITKKLDHPEEGELNNIIFHTDDNEPVNPTAEVICQWIYEQLQIQSPHLRFKVRVYEQIEPKHSWCECGDWE